MCAGTNIIGIDLLKKQPDLAVCAVDRCKAMQRVGTRLAEDRGLRIHSVICDVHELPFPDNHFDVVTLQWATRHLRACERLMSGLALRFARVKGYRPDKKAQDADTVDTVRAIYVKQEK